MSYNKKSLTNQYIVCVPRSALAPALNLDPCRQLGDAMVLVELDKQSVYTFAERF